MYLRRYLVAGLLVWLPVGTTILVFKLLLDLIDRLLLFLAPWWRPEEWLGGELPGWLEAITPGLSAILAFVLLLGTGVVAANFFGRKLVAWYEGLLNRIPFVRTVYGGVKSFTEVVFSDKNTAFKKALLIEYPRKGVYSLAFQTSDALQEVQEKTAETVVTVFLPTTPNPTSGFILFLPRDEIIELEMSVEDALKMIISLGVVVPEPQRLPQAAPVPSTELP